MKSARRALVLLAVCLSVLGGARAASAQVSDARARVEALARQLEADPATRSLTQALVARARQALARAKHARDAGDHRHGAELEALALELAQAASDLTRAVRAEGEVSAIEQRVLDTESRVVRARALVEQTTARRGRAAEQLRATEQQAREKKAKP